MDILTQVTYTHGYWIILLPLIFASADIVTGWIQASINGTWDSTKMRKGLYRKSGELGVICLFIVTEYAIDIVAKYHVATGVSIYILVTEAVSIFENLNQAGITIPAFIRDNLKKVKEGMDNGENIQSDR